MKIVLAYSGGLDTSVLLSWIKEKYSAEMIAFCADIGQEEELKGLDKKAMKTGASKLYIDDLSAEFAQLCMELITGSTRVDSFRALAVPNKEPELRMLSNLLTVSDRFGVGIALVLVEQPHQSIRDAELSVAQLSGTQIILDSQILVPLQLRDLGAKERDAPPTGPESEGI